eukprot:12592910-Alexandrium_andersonii.AAC.1
MRCRRLSERPKVVPWRLLAAGGGGAQSPPGVAQVSPRGGARALETLSDAYLTAAGLYDAYLA